MTVLLAWFADGWGCVSDGGARAGPSGARPGKAAAPRGRGHEIHRYPASAPAAPAVRAVSSWRYPSRGWEPGEPSDSITARGAASAAIVSARSATSAAGPGG